MKKINLAILMNNVAFPINDEVYQELFDFLWANISLDELDLNGIVVNSLRFVKIEDYPFFDHDSYILKKTGKGTWVLLDNINNF